jgi:hypothetical protein
LVRRVNDGKLLPAQRIPPHADCAALIRPALADVNLRRGLLRLAVGLTVLWLVFWTFAYVLRPVASEDAPPLPAFSARTDIAVAIVGVLGLPWVVAGFRPDRKTDKT